jgi:hypothetical protein
MSLGLTASHRVNSAALNSPPRPSRAGYRLDVFGQGGSIRATADGVIVLAAFQKEVPAAASLPFSPKLGLQLSDPSSKASNGVGDAADLLVREDWYGKTGRTETGRPRRMSEGGRRPMAS